MRRGTLEKAHPCLEASSSKAAHAGLSSLVPVAHGRQEEDVAFTEEAAWPEG